MYNIESYKKEMRYRSQKEEPRKKLSVLIRFVKSFYDCPYHTLHILNSREKNVDTSESFFQLYVSIILAFCHHYRQC